MPHKKVALQLIEETLKELESPKGSLLSAIQKLQRTSDIINDDDKKIWCAIQLGDTKYTKPITELLKFVIEAENTKNKSFQENLDKRIQELAKLGVKANIHYSDEELTLKNIESGGGYNNIGFIEEKYADLVRKKQGNDGTYYKNSLNQLKFSGTVSNCFDVLKNAVDDKLLDLNPVIAEQLMLAFKAISSDKEEEWSQALTTCRRLLEGLADELYPASKEKFNGRAVGQGQYVNRLWAFMDGAIQSDSNKDLAKAHIDFLGSWLDKVNKLTNKGVHAELDRIEAVKSVFHTYLVVADLLEYMSNTKTSVSKPDINKATLDELEALLNINRTVAKEIVKARVREGKLDLDILKNIKGIGAKTLSNIQEVFVM